MKENIKWHDHTKSEMILHKKVSLIAVFQNNGFKHPNNLNTITIQSVRTSKEK